MAVKRRRRPAGVVLAPGAGAGSDQPSLVAIDRRLSDDGIAVLRIDFPYRLAGRRSPDRPEVLLATVGQASEALATKLGVAQDRIVLGGRSMGGRICSMAVAAGLPAAGLVLVSYPLHPPGRPERLRTEHFPAIGAPCLFISGDRDAFGSPEELTAATAAIAGPVEHFWAPGGDHGLRRRDEMVADVVEHWLLGRPVGLPAANGSGGTVACGAHGRRAGRADDDQRG